MNIVVEIAVVGIHKKTAFLKITTRCAPRIVKFPLHRFWQILNMCNQIFPLHNLRVNSKEGFGSVAQHRLVTAALKGELRRPDAGKGDSYHWIACRRPGGGITKTTSTSKTLNTQSNTPKIPLYLRTPSFIKDTGTSQMQFKRFIQFIINIINI